MVTGQTSAIPRFVHARAPLSEVTMHYVTAGEGDAVVLLHGWPQTWREWRHVIPLLAARYRVIAPDLRGLGDTSRPADGYHSGAVASDIAELMLRHLGIARFHLVGHDWGGPAAFALACLQPEAVRTLTIVDVTIPGIGPDISQGGRRWHHAFHMTPDLPERLVEGRERDYLSWFYREFAWRPDAISATDIDEYLRTYTQPGAMRAGFEYYRSIPRNVAENRALLASGFRLRMPVLAVGGGRTEARGRANEPALSLLEIADDVEGTVIPDSGHFVPEEQPRLLAEHLLRFLAKVR
jgi:pimeloyl-ACP methyl ester carboxylesterase